MTIGVALFVQIGELDIGAVYESELLTKPGEDGWEAYITPRAEELIRDVSTNLDSVAKIADGYVGSKQTIRMQLFVGSDVYRTEVSGELVDTKAGDWTIRWKLRGDGPLIWEKM